MVFPKWLAVIALATLPLATSAQQNQQPDPADPNAPVPAVGYVSAIGSYQSATDGAATPDAVWRAANEAVAGPGEHGGHAEHAIHDGDTTASPKINVPQALHAPAMSAMNPHASHAGHNGQSGHGGHHSEGK